MSIKSDRWITKMSREYRMIEPFADRQVREGVISYGVSSYGYDMRVAPEFKIFTNALSAVVDPKRFDPKSFVEFTGDVCIVPPNSFALASSVEYFRIPRNVLTICVGKSTYARCGIIVNVKPSHSGSNGVTFTIIPHRAYVDFPTQIVSTFRGIRKYSTDRASANEFGGIRQTSLLMSTSDRASKCFGSTIVEFTFVKIRN